MSITALDQALFYRDWKLFQVFAGQLGEAEARPSVNLGNGEFRTVYDIVGVWDVDRMILRTRLADGETVVEAARFYRDGVRLVAVTAIELPLDDVRTGGMRTLFAGNDLITGSKWNNTLRGYAGDDTIRGGWNEDRLVGNAGRDWLDGQAGDDTLYGGNGDDLLVGRNENDMLFGGAGIDRIGGNAGRDTMTGGDAADLFVFRKGDGRHDVITDFDPTEDRFLISGGAETFDEITLTVSGGDVLMSFADVRVRLIGAADRIGEIGEGDFRFE